MKCKFDDLIICKPELDKYEHGQRASICLICSIHKLKRSVELLRVK